MSRLLSVLFFIIYLTLNIPSNSLASNLDSGAMPLEVMTTGGRIILFHVLIVDTNKGRLIGLSNKDRLVRNEGLLLDFKKVAKPKMWMKNTRFPVDMLFVKSDGRIADIYRQAEPFSLKIITPKEKVRYVLEISGGEADNNGIQIDDYLNLMPFPKN